MYGAKWKIIVLSATEDYRTTEQDKENIGVANILAQIFISRVIQKSAILQKNGRVSHLNILEYSELLFHMQLLNYLKWLIEAE